MVKEIKIWLELAKENIGGIEFDLGIARECVKKTIKENNYIVKTIEGLEKNVAGDTIKSEIIPPLRQAIEINERSIASWEKDIEVFIAKIKEAKVKVSDLERLAKKYSDDTTEI